MSRALSFIEMPHRSVKPRTTGLTIARDKGISFSEAEGYMESVGEFIDFMKIRHIFVLNMSADENDFTKRKIKLYRDNQIDVNPGGIVHEMAYVNNCVEKTFDTLAELGFSAVECSENIIELTLDQKKEHVKLAKKSGLKVMFEVGEKYPTASFDLDKTEKDIKELFNAGCDYAIVEKAILEQCLGKKGESKESFKIQELAKRIGLDRLVFEAESSDHHYWLIKEFGGEVSIGPNLDINIIAAFEATRQTFSREGGYTYLIDKANKLK